MPFSDGYNQRMEFSFGDGLGKLYVSIAAVWSTILLIGIMFLVKNRNIPFLKIRNIYLGVSAVVTLHVYWVLCFLAYGFEGYFPCGTEFWIMSVYLPIGFALFHASNSQLLYIATLQRRYASNEGLLLEKNATPQTDRGWRRQVQKLQAKKGIERTMTYIGIGMTLQIICALIVFCVSRRFHKFGIVGNLMPEGAAGRGQCRRGWEWLPSILWQFFWSWIYAPYLLWKVRNIRDVYFWRIQTICCCVAGLPASPMWLLALYLPQMHPVNKYFIPPLWFSPSIFLMEAFMIFVPCWQIVKSRKLRSDTLAILDEWEKQKNGSSLGSDLNTVTTSSRLSNKPSLSSTTSSRKAQPHLYTMVALEKALKTNSTPLLLFAALKDFSGENISFLTHVQEWKTHWYSQQRQSPVLPNDCIAEVDDIHLERQQFNKAVEIYSSFVSLKYSNFPINISHNELQELQDVFEGSAAMVNTALDDINAATPFDDCSINPPVNDIECGIVKDGVSVISTIPDNNKSFEQVSTNTLQARDSVANTYQMKNLGSKLPIDLLIPDNFGPDIFDHAMESIKYTVLTNTWPKFVNAGYANKLEKESQSAKWHDRLSDYRPGWSRLMSI